MKRDSRAVSWLALVVGLALGVPAPAQPLAVALEQAPVAEPSEPEPAPAIAAAGDDSMAQFKWLRGCWQGKVNQREFREMWLGAAGGTMIGAGQTVLQGKTVDLEFMRIEQRADSSIAYVLVQPGQKDSVYKLVLIPGDEHVFLNNSIEFPNRVIYRPGTEGWMYARVEGRINGAAKQVVYPMRRIDCISGESAIK